MSLTLTYRRPPTSHGRLERSGVDSLPASRSGLEAEPVAAYCRTEAGAICLLVGPPGSGKSGLALQLALDHARAGRRTAVLLSEESPARARGRAERLLGPMGVASKAALLGHVRFVPVGGTGGGLAGEVERSVLQPGELGLGVSLVVLDSVQGNGVAAGCGLRAAADAVAAARSLQAAGIAIVLVGHVTKTNAVRGPRSLEHAADVVWHRDRRGGRRTLAVPKNRFGPATLRPVVLRMDPLTTRLGVSPHAAARHAEIEGFEAGRGVVKVQAVAALSPGRPGRAAVVRGLDRVEVVHVLACLTRVPPLDADLADLDVSVACRGTAGPGRPVSGGQEHDLHLPVSLAVAGAVLAREIPPDVLAIGELDLAGRVLPLSSECRNAVVAALRAGELAGRRLVCSADSLRYLPWNCGCVFVGVSTLVDAVERLWPSTTHEAVQAFSPQTRAAP